MTLPGFKIIARAMTIISIKLQMRENVIVSKGEILFFIGHRKVKYFFLLAMERWNTFFIVSKGEILTDWGPQVSLLPSNSYVEFCFFSIESILLYVDKDYLKQLLYSTFSHHYQESVFLAKQGSRIREWTIGKYCPRESLFFKTDLRTDRQACCTVPQSFFLDFVLGSTFAIVYA